MSRRELKTVMRQIHRDKKFTFKPSLTPLTERLAESARYHNKSISQTNIKIQSRQAFPNQNTSRSSSQIQDAILETKSAQQLPQPKKRKRWEDLHDNHKIYQERIDKQKQELLQYRMSIEIQDCTFKPNTVKTPVSKKVSQDFSSHLTKQSGISPLRANDIFERNLKWKNEIKQKIQVKQDEVKKAEMEGVTFQPEITNFDKNSLQANSKTQLESNMKAIDLYVKRIQKAKEENERKSKIIYSNKIPEQPIQSYLTKPLTKPMSPRLSYMSRSTTSMSQRRESSNNQTPLKNIQNSKQNENGQNKVAYRKVQIERPQDNSKFEEYNDVSSVKQQKFEKALNTLHRQILNLNM